MSKSVGVKKKSIWRDKASWELLMLCVPTLLAFTLFHYVPMIGIILPFRRFMPAKGLFGSPWVGFENFRFLFTSVELARIMRNTVLYSLWFMEAILVSDADAEIETVGGSNFEDSEEWE